MNARQSKNEKRMDLISALIRHEDPKLSRYQSAEVAQYLIERYGENAEVMAGAPYTLTDGSKSW